MTDAPKRPFWMIYGIGQREPRAMHWTREDADRPRQAPRGCTSGLEGAEQAADAWITCERLEAETLR